MDHLDIILHMKARPLDLYFIRLHMNLKVRLSDLLNN